MRGFAKDFGLAVFFPSSFLFHFSVCVIFHEQYRVPHKCSDKLESYVFQDKEYILQSLTVNWDNANILCRGHHNGTLALLDSKEKAEFLAEALSESQLPIESVWVGARRSGADDPQGYRWRGGVELRRTALDVLADDAKDIEKHYPLWLNRTHVPVPEGGADCVALERVAHDKPVFVDLPCHLERGFACERDANPEIQVTELRTVRCRTGLYRVYEARKNWDQAAAYCVLKNMNLATITTLRCLKKLGMAMLKTRPSIESAWLGARGEGGIWKWSDTGAGLLSPPPYTDVSSAAWPPLREPNSLKQSGCLQLDRHTTHPPVFLEARCERKMPFICYKSSPSLRKAMAPSSDDMYYYVLVRELLQWQHAYDNCIQMKGTLASLDSNDILIQLLLVMGENQNEPVGHIWVSGRLNSSRDATTDVVNYSWYNPASKKRIPDPRTAAVDSSTAVPFSLPWLDEDFTMDSQCLNLDREDHLKGLLYGLPCDTAQYSICMIEKTRRQGPSDNTTGLLSPMSDDESEKLQK